MELDAFEVKQNDETFYITYMNAEQISDIHKIKVDIYKHEKDEGYQRTISEKRSEEFARFIINAKGVSPLSILINVRGKLLFKREKGHYGKLIIPDDSSMWIVDGQHRRGGIVFALSQFPEIKNFQIPVIITNLKETYDEAKQFIIINKTQKGVRSDLAERLLSKLLEEPEEIISQMPKTVIRGITWIPKAIEISEIINDREDSVWYNKIRFPNESKLMTLVSQKSFTDSLGPIIKNELFELYNTEEISEILVRYWNAIKELCSDAFNNPDEYLIQKTSGIFTLHKLFPLITSYCGDKLTKEKMKEILSNMEKGMGSQYWHSTGEVGLTGTSQKAFNIIYRKLAIYLEKGNKKIVRKKRPFDL